MLFILLSLFYVFIFIMSNDLQQKELKKDYKDWKKITGRDYD